MIVRKSLFIVAALLALGCPDRRGSPTFTLNPTSGPNNTEVTFSITGLEPGAGVLISDGRTSSSTRADANGNAVVTQRVFGEPGETLNFTATSGSGADTVRLTATFTVTR